MAITEELLNLKFNSWTDDVARHTLFVKNVELSSQLVADTTLKSAYFNGSSYLTIIDNQDDWLLGSVINNNRVTSKNWAPTDSSNVFTFDCWIYPIPSSNRYYPIISSFKDVWFNNSKLNLGWVLQIDTQTQKLQLISYMFGDCTRRVIESTDVITINEWNHIALMVWMIDESHLKYFFISGIADGGVNSGTGIQNNKACAYQVDSFPISNILSKEAYNGTIGSPDYSPVYIGLGPKTSFTDPTISETFHFNANSAYKFLGYMGNIRVGLGTRYSTSGGSFNPYSDVTTTSSTTSTMTTSSTTLTSTTLAERGEIPLEVDSYDLLALKLRQDTNDLTNRHYLLAIGDINFSLTELGCKSLSFNGNNYLLARLNTQDFSLGSDLLVNKYDTTQPLCRNNNQFSLELWLKPIVSSERYLGICGSFSENFFPVDFGDTTSFNTITARRDYKTGWSLLLDTELNKLLFVNFTFGRVIDIVTSNLRVTNNQWTHIAFMSTIYNGLEGLKFLFVNGQPDMGNPFNNSNMNITNGIHRGSVNSFTDSYAPFYLGLGANPYIENSLNYQNASKFSGNMSSFRLSSATRYPTNGSGFIPNHLIDIISVTTGTTSTSTTTVTSSTTEFSGYISITGSTITNNNDNDSNWIQLTCQ